MFYISIQPTMLFLLFLISSVDGFRRKIDNKNYKNNIKYEHNDWSHGEVEWEFTENSYINKFNISYKENDYKLLNNSNLRRYKIKNKFVIVKKEKSNNYYAFYSGLLKTFYIELLTNKTLTIFLEELCFSLQYSNINSTIIFIILNYLLRLKYEYNKKIEIIKIKKYNISELNNYLSIKKTSSLFIFTLFTIFGRNIHNAE
jgi:hypothetical protein